MFWADFISWIFNGNSIREDHLVNVLPQTCKVLSQHVYDCVKQTGSSNIDHHTTVQKEFFKRCLLCSPNLQIFDQKYSKKKEHCKYYVIYYYNTNIYILKCNLLYFCEFSAAIAPVVSFTRSFRNCSILLIWCSFLLINVKHRCAD